MAEAVVAVDPVVSVDRTATVLGCPVHLLTRTEIEVHLQSFAASDRLHHIVTLNPEQIMAARSNPTIRSAIARADLITIDGVGLAMALRLAKLEPAVRVTGVDLVPWLASSTIPTYLLGGRPGAAELARDRLGPSSPVCGAWSGGQAAAFDDNQTIDRIRTSQAVAVAVAYGVPGQLAWIERNRAALEAAGVRIVIGVGGTLDYLSGMVRRAPAPIRAIGLEFAWRLVSEPWRIRRQAVLPHFAFLAGCEVIGRRRTGH